MEYVRFTHVWDRYRGWLTTTLHPGDFVYIEILGKNDIDGVIYLGFTESKRRYILCDKSIKQKLLK